LGECPVEERVRGFRDVVDLFHAFLHQPESFRCPACCPVPHPHQGIPAWLDHRHAAWPHTPNRHVLVSGKTALGGEPVSRRFLNWNLERHGVSIERIRRDRVLHEALTARADPLHLALVFGISQTTASKYTLIACDLLSGQPDH
jgi:hypothetical protein